MPTINDYYNSDISKRRFEIEKLKGKHKDNEIEKLSVALFKFIQFKDEWITKGANESMIHFAEIAGRFLAPLNPNDKSSLTNSQIRNIYGEIKRIQMHIEKDGWDTVKPSFLILKPKVAYAAGRNRNLGIISFKLIFDTLSDKVTSKNEYLNFCNIVEAILAYHKSYGGK